MTTIKNENYKAQILRENYAAAEANGKDFESVADYARNEAECDPGFFRWLFNSEGQDFECPDTEAFEDFLNQI